MVEGKKCYLHLLQAEIFTYPIFTWIISQPLVLSAFVQETMINALPKRLSFLFFSLSLFSVLISLMWFQSLKLQYSNLFFFFKPFAFYTLHVLIPAEAVATIPSRKLIFSPFFSGLAGSKSPAYCLENGNSLFLTFSLTFRDHKVCDTSNSIFLKKGEWKKHVAQVVVVCGG